MILSVILDNDGYVIQFCTGGYLENETAHFEIEEIPDDFYTNYHAYKVEDNALVLDTNKLVDVAAEHEIDELRERREVECFSYINRGELWYKRLTENELGELNVWYQKWLDVTETKVVPEKPSWLV